MAVEIERKFLVTSDAWRQGAFGERLRQGYIANEPARSVRVRVQGQSGFLTIKGQGQGQGQSKALARLEFEYEIPVADAEVLLETLCGGKLLEKTRYKVRVGTHLWEIDEFHGANGGLIVAEIELGAEDEPFEHPEWLGAEVSHDPRYLNVQLIVRPFGTWTR